MNFRIVIDTREQQPWEFGCESVTTALPCGDYSVAGLENRLAVERKSLGDFVHTVIHDMKRFNHELDRLANCQASCIVVEADLDAVLRGRHQRELRASSPQSILGKAHNIYLRYSIPVFWCGSRQAARAFTDGFLRMSARELIKQKGIAQADRGTTRDARQYHAELS